MSEKEYLKRDVIKQAEQTWCKISTEGKLEYLDWSFVEQQAAAFDVAGEGGVRDQSMTMCKLIVLVRQQTIEKVAHLVTRFGDFNNDAAAVIIYDPTRVSKPDPATFVFFHVGDDISQPARLVDSIKKSNPGARIIMCTDIDTPEIEGTERRGFKVDRTRLMVERWRRWSELEIDGPAVYLDTDMVVRGVIDPAAILGGKKYAFCNRTFDRMVPFNGQQRGLDFSEHHDRPLGVVYPILGCFTVTRSTKEWQMLYDLFEQQPDKYQSWYGDQEVLRNILSDLKVSDYNLVEESQYACLPEHADKHSPLIVHYKGNRKNATA